MSWYSPHTVARYYSPAHIRFVLRNLGVIKLGMWPTQDRPDSTDGAYVESPGELPAVNKKGYYSAPWENVISLGIEVEKRIDMTGRDGDLARTHYIQGTSYFRLARDETKHWRYLTNTERLNKAIEIQERVENAINWASGNGKKDIERRKRSYG